MRRKEEDNKIRFFTSDILDNVSDKPRKKEQS